MCSMLSVILAKSDYLYVGNSVFDNLREAEKIFEDEVYIVSYAKCVLLRNEKLDDFCINGVSVIVYENIRGYELFFADYRLDLEIYDKQIIDFSIERL